MGLPLLKVAAQGRSRSLLSCHGTVPHDLQVPSDQKQITRLLSPGGLQRTPGIASIGGGGKSTVPQPVCLV